MEERPVLTEFMNLKSDFAFKKVFGNLDNKPCILRLLNILFKGKLNITDVTYHDKEVLPASAGGKRIVYDVYCTTPIDRDSSPFFRKRLSGSKKMGTNDHHFILEMQNYNIKPFDERMLYYASKAISSQGKEGWNYELDPVFTIAITDFSLSHLKKKVFRDFKLIDGEDNEVLTEKLHLMFCSLAELPLKWKDCQTDLEEILYIMKLFKLIYEF